MKFPILLPNIFNYPFTYESDFQLKVGDFVEVPFGKSKSIGVVWNEFEKSNNKHFKTKKIIKKLDIPSLKKNIIEFLNWFSDYNIVPKGMALKLVLLGGKPVKIFEKKFYQNFHSKIKKNSIKFTSEQKEALNQMNLSNKKFKVHVLQGITGSGKTIVYFEVLKKILKEGYQGLILLPEIGLTGQFEKKFIEFFGFKPAIWHSGITKKNKEIIWSGVINEKIKIVIGARSSLFLPFKNLGLITVDEEHDQSYKQSEGFKFSGRDLAIKRAQLEDIPVYLGSATPSLQTLKLVKEKKYKKFDLLRRVDGKKPPKLIPLDITNSPLVGGIALETMSIIGSTIKKGEQVLIFINRRGFAPLYECDDCGWVASCPECESNLVFHKSKNRLICHKCESAYALNKNCPDCNSSKLNMYGSGTERVEDVLKSAFSNVPIIRVDHDTTKLKGSIEAIYEKVHSSNEAILVGTQMLSKGHDFPRVTLCIILNADNGLISPEINALEKISQQLIQVSGRAGRNNNLAKVIIQTRYPDDINLKQIKTGDYRLVADQCLKVNKELNMPPYSSICILRAVSPNTISSSKFLDRTQLALSNKKGISTIGPLPSIPFKTKGNVRNHLIIKSPSKTYLNRVLKFLTKEFESWPETKKVKWSYDLDPYDMS